jgi:hypothetical protein
MQEALKNPHYKKIWEKVINSQSNFDARYDYQVSMKPITLEDILMFFGKIFNESLNAFKFVQLTCEGAFITMKPIEHELHRIEVVLTKPLHEQTPETWEKIAELI